MTAAEIVALVFTSLSAAFTGGTLAVLLIDARGRRPRGRGDSGPAPHRPRRRGAIESPGPAGRGGS